MNVNLPLLCVATLISVTYPVSISSIYFKPNNQKSLSYEKFHLWVMLSLCFSHGATVGTPFCSNVFNFLAKNFLTLRDFLLMWKENNQIMLVIQECKHIQPLAETVIWWQSSSVWVITKSLRYAQQIINTQAGNMKLGLSYVSFRVIRGRVNRVSPYMCYNNNSLWAPVRWRPQLMVMPGQIFYWKQAMPSVSSTLQKCRILCDVYMKIKPMRTDRYLRIIKPICW